MNFYSLLYSLAVLAALFCQCCCTTALDDGAEVSERFKIEGTVEQPPTAGRSDRDWYANIRIYTDSGHKAFLREDGTFVVHNLPWGAHFVHVISPNTAYAPVRIDINAKGKYRVRRVNILQPSKVEVIPGPLTFSPLGPVRHFQAREQWRLTDLLFNPMVLMTVVPLALLLLMPKFGDTELRKEVEAQLQMPKTDTPDLSEFMTNLFKGGPGAAAAAAAATDGEARRSVKSGAVGGMGARGGRRKEK